MCARVRCGDEGDPDMPNIVTLLPSHTAGGTNGDGEGVGDGDGEGYGEGYGEGLVDADPS